MPGADVIAGLPFNCTTAPDDDDDAATALAGDCAMPSGSDWYRAARRTSAPSSATSSGQGVLYAVWSGARMLDVFRGKWMVFAGASNLILTARFANMNGGVGGDYQLPRHSSRRCSTRAG